MALVSKVVICRLFSVNFSGEIILCSGTQIEHQQFGVHRNMSLESIIPFMHLHVGRPEWHSSQLTEASLRYGNHSTADYRTKMQRNTIKWGYLRRRIFYVSR